MNIKTENCIPDFKIKDLLETPSDSTISEEFKDFMEDLRMEQQGGIV